MYTLYQCVQSARHTLPPLNIHWIAKTFLGRRHSLLISAVGLDWVGRDLGWIGFGMDQRCVYEELERRWGQRGFHARVANQGLSIC